MHVEVAAYASNVTQGCLALLILFFFFFTLTFLLPSKLYFSVAVFLVHTLFRENCRHYVIPE